MGPPRRSAYPIVLGKVTAEPLPQRRFSKIALTALAMVLLAAGIGYRPVRKLLAKPVLTDKDTIVLADFINQTGDPIWDSTLKFGLDSTLRQSPFLSILSDDQVAATLRLMQRSPGTPLLGDVVRDVQPCRCAHVP